MAAIVERPLYGRIAIETSPWASSFTWTDRTATLVNGIQYSEGGRLGTPGQPTVDVGTLTATFKDAATVPVVGDLVRLKRSGTSEYFWVGYVQDVSQRIVFGSRTSATTPFVMTTIYCNDWVGYVAQFQAIGVGGADVSTGTDETDSNYQWTNRIASLNKIVDSSFATKILLATGSGGAGQFIGDTDLVGSLSDHLNFIMPTSNTIWFGKHNLPTNITTGRTSLVEVSTLAAISSSGKTFTDVAGSAGHLHYTEIDFENSTQNVANTIVINNHVRFNVPNEEVTRIGGFNENNYVVVNNQNVIGIPIDTTYTAKDTTSITNYGVRQTELDTNVLVAPSNTNSFNLIINPSIEYSDDGYSGGSNEKARRRKPSEDTNAFTAYTGLWAMRTRKSVASATTRVNYSGGESDGIPVVAGSTYYFSAYALRGTTSRTDVRSFARIDWINDDETTISSSTGSTVNLTTANTWYLTSVSGTAPSGAVRATVSILYERSGGGNHTVGDRLWADAFLFTKGSTETYFDGDTPWTSSLGYLWTGGVGSSPSYRVANLIDNAALDFLSKYSTTSLRASRIRWNAQEDLTAISSITVGSTISLVYKSTTITYRIVGIDGTVDPDRYMIDYYLAKV